MRTNQLVYALYGASNTGKTSALRLLARKLEKVATANGHIPDYGDFQVTFNIKKVKVAIISGGDDESVIQNGLKAVNKDSPSEIIFCASRTKGQTTEFLGEKFKNDQLRWVSNMYVYGDSKQQIEICKQSVADFLYLSLISEL